MPSTALSPSDILNENHGQQSDAASVAVELLPDQATTDGTAVLVCIHHGTAIQTPAGWTLDAHSGNDTITHISFFRRQPVSADETSWTFSTVTGTTAWQWEVLEVQRLADSPFYKNASASAAGNVGSVDVSIGGVVTNDLFMYGAFTLKTTVDPATLGSLAITPSTTPNRIHWTVLADQRWADEGANHHMALTWRYFPYPQAGTIAARAAITGNSTLGSDFWECATVAYVSAESGRADPLDFATGFEHGVTPNTASPLANRQMLDVTAGTWGTQWQVLAAAARTGSYGLRISQAAAAGRVGWDTDTLGTTKDATVTGFHVRVNSGSGTVVVAEITPAAGVAAQLVYDTSTTKFGMRWGSGGTPAWQAGTTALGDWVWVDVSAVGLDATTRTIRWACEENGLSVEQTAPADLTGQTTGGLASVTLGLNAAQTMQADYDDVCISTFAGDYRLAKHKVLLLGPDPAGTPSVTGAGGTGVFNTFSANGTLAAWNATTVQSALSEVPLVISTSSTGLVQTTASTTTWAIIPMDTYTLQAGERLDYVGVVAALWANSGQNATMDLRGSSSGLGNDTTWLTTGASFNPGNAAQPPSATVPSWVRGKWPETNNWSQSILDSAALLFGRSSDATPDIGIHCAYLEVAVQVADTQPLFGEAGADLRVETDTDPLSGGICALRVYTPAGVSGTLRYTAGGVTTEVSIAAASNPQTVTLAAADVPGVERVEFEPAS